MSGLLKYSGYFCSEEPTCEFALHSLQCAQSHYWRCAGHSIGRRLGSRCDLALAICGKIMTTNIIGWIFGIAVFAAGLVNTFWGNDPEFGVLILLLSSLYFPPTSNILSAISKQVVGFPVPKIGKIVLGIFIVWATLGVGELFDKIDLMMQDF